jgi:lipoprotein signal peptidase
VTETPPETTAAPATVAVEPEPSLQPPGPSPAAPEPPVTPADVAPTAAPLVPGERLAVPFGATRFVADYGRPRASYVFLGLVSVLTLASDIFSKSWAEHHLDGYPGTLDVWKNHITLILAKNRGGAWGLLQSTKEDVRRPFFLLVSVAAIAFIMTLYRRLQPRQHALKWGLPLVLGGALGNVFDRIRYGHVIDFIDFHVVYKGIEHHWPTFNVADIAICVGVGLMAVDMFTSKRGPRLVLRAPHVPPAQSGEPAVGWNGAATPVEAPPAAAPTVEAAPAEGAPPVTSDAAPPAADAGAPGASAEAPRTE